MDVVYFPEVEDELNAMPDVKERTAALNAVENLEALGTQLPFPHASAVKGTKLRELRPRGGRSPWRLLYRQYEDFMVILAVVPEAKHDPRGFHRGCEVAERRYRDLAGE